MEDKLRFLNLELKILFSSENQNDKKSFSNYITLTKFKIFLKNPLWKLSDLIQNFKSSQFHKLI